jgi:hypothetical protein
MIALTDQESCWVAEVANRLRLIQADAFHMSPEQRRELLGEEISRVLKDVSPANRKRYLEALMARFPIAGLDLGTPAPASTLSAPTPSSAPTETFEQLSERYFKAAASQPEAQRHELACKLREAGLASIDGEAVAPEIAANLQKALGLPPEQQPHLEELVKLALLLIDAFHRLDQTALATMRELSPRSSLLKRPQDFRAAATKYIATGQESIEPQVRVVSGLMGALLAAMLGGGRDFGRQYVERLSPAAIEDVVMGEGGGGGIPGFGKSKKEKCWDKYVLLAKEFETSDLVDRRVRECFAAFVEKKVLGAR